MELLSDPRVLLGVVLVTLVALFRFNSAPPRRPSLPPDISAFGRFMKIVTRIKDEPDPALFPPPRANTTFFKFLLYRLAYALVGVTVYISILIPGVAGEVDKLLRTNGALDIPVLEHAGPIVLAFAVAVLFPLLPPFRAGERAIRRALYERACIPAQQLCERNRLRSAPYTPDDKVLASVKAELVTEGFNGSDLGMEPLPTTRSLWTKAALLRAHIEAWQAADRYKTAFAVLRELDGTTRSVDRISEVYEALKADARVCLRALYEHPGQLETQGREQSFRSHCRELLDHMYDLMSRVSLHSHFTDRERVACFKEIGFQLTRSEAGPVPEPDDLVALAVVLGAVAFLPLSRRVGPTHALLISFEVYAAVLIPIVIAGHYPVFARTRPSRTPNLAFPLAAGAATAVVALVLHVIGGALNIGPPPSLDLVYGWNRYIGHSYPWTFLLALISALIAWRMRGDPYPDTTGQGFLARVKEWGSPLDAAIFLGAGLLLLATYVLPKVEQLSGREPDWTHLLTDWKRLLIPAVIAGTVGFFVPTWYRADARRRQARQWSGPHQASGDTSILSGEFGQVHGKR